MRRDFDQQPNGDTSRAIRLSHASGVPVYRQIVDQIEFLIEAGKLSPGDRLPSSRLLASHLGVNRNTIALAYKTLAEGRYVESHRRGGMVVKSASEAKAARTVREQALYLLRRVIDDCLGAGLQPDEITSAAWQHALHAERVSIRVAFVECNDERALYFAGELSRHLMSPVRPLVLGGFDSAEAFDVDLVVTTFFHLAEVRRLARSRAQVVGIVVGPHLQTLLRLAQIPTNHRIGILYSTIEQADLIRSSLIQAGLTNVDIFTQESIVTPDDVDVIIIPSEMPEIRAKLASSIETIEFGNVLDEASVRVLEQVVEEIRERKASASCSLATRHAGDRAWRSRRHT
ncbi:MAG: GntR family transcriptional regulator [bacterium]|nr:GntR family transcriptional regulator [bacterium]